MSREAASPRPIADEASSDARKQSGTRRIIIGGEPDDARPSSVELVGWPEAGSQDDIPTQPASDPPCPPSRPPVAQERSSLTLEMPPPGYEEVRDTIPAPPPDHAD